MRLHNLKLAALWPCHDIDDFGPRCAFRLELLGRESADLRASCVVVGWRDAPDLQVAVFVASATARNLASADMGHLVTLRNGQVAIEVGRQLVGCAHHYQLLCGSDPIGYAKVGA